MQFRGNVAAVGDHGMGRDAERIGDLFVGHALHHADDDLLFTGAQRLGFHRAGTRRRQPLDGRDEEFVLHGVVRGEFVLAVEDVEQHAVEFVRAARRVVFDDDILQLAQLDINLVVLAAEDVDRIGRVLLAREQRLDIRKNGLLLVGHVALHFGGILVEKAHDGERNVA